MTGILLHYIYQFSSATCYQGATTAKAQISASEAMRKDAQVPSVAPSMAPSMAPSVAPSVASSVVGAVMGAVMGALVGALW